MARLLLILPLMFDPSVAKQLDMDWPSEFRYVPMPAQNTITAPNVTPACHVECGSFGESASKTVDPLEVSSLSSLGDAAHAAGGRRPPIFFHVLTICLAS